MRSAARNSAILAAGLLAACTPVVAPDGAPPFRGKPLGYELRQTGIGVPGSPLEVSFDRVNPGAETALTKLLGQFPPPSAATCAGRTARAFVFNDGLTLFFDGRTFIRWSKDESSAGTVGCQKAST